MLPSIQDFVKLTGFSARDIKITNLAHGNRKATLILGSYINSPFQEDDSKRDLVWHRITAWGGLAGDLAMYIKRGTWLSISARIHQKSSIGKDGLVKNWEELVLVDFRKICTTAYPTKQLEAIPSLVSNHTIRFQESPTTTQLQPLN
jgi:single-stranded DNA-binding protein